MKTALKLSALILAVLVFSCACSAVTGANVSDEKVRSDAQRLLRSASLVVSGECVRTHTDENGALCCDLRIDDILAGTADGGELIHCAGSPMKEGGEYLLYLAGDPSAVYHTEDSLGYTLLTDAPLALSEGDVSFEGATLSIEDIKQGIEEQMSIVSAPADSMFYRDMDSLASAVSEIFIGRVISVPELTATPFRTVSEGATVENTLDASMVGVEVYGSLKGSLRYGDDIELVYCPAMCESITDAATLKDIRYTSDDASVPVKGGVYMFFLVGSPDAKQSLYFTVNPIQGLVELDSADRIHTSVLNFALAGQYSLDSLVKTIKAAL